VTDEDLAAIEARADLAPELSSADVPALVAEVRAARAEIARLRAYVIAQIGDLHERALSMGADYLPVACPRCGRLRLQATGDEATCEKCAWTPTVDAVLAR
jgi:hypothetical protein